jgi:hypothetical protein
MDVANRITTTVSLGAASSTIREGRDVGEVDGSLGSICDGDVVDKLVKAERGESVGGLIVGIKTWGATDGSGVVGKLGNIVGGSVGESEGPTVGLFEGKMLGLNDGCSVVQAPTADGALLGVAEGRIDGVSVGARLG